MIKATRLDRMEFVLNSDLIEHLEATPDTVVTLVSGKKFVVTESVDELIRRIVAYQRSIRDRPLTEASA